MILDDLKKSLRAKEEECDSLSMAKEKLEKYVQRALQATQIKYKAAVQTLQSQAEEKTKQLKEANAKVSAFILLFDFFLFWRTRTKFSFEFAFLSFQHID